MKVCFNRLRSLHRKTPVFADHRHLHREEELNKHPYENIHMKVVVLLAVKIYTVILWNKTLYSVTDTYQRLG